jgi:hypothetical protein
MLTDLGAACCYSAAREETRYVLERIEVRALGCLVAELVDMTQGYSGDEYLRSSLTAIAHRCMASTVRSRPAFAEVAGELGRLQDCAAGDEE